MKLVRSHLTNFVASLLFGIAVVGCAPSEPGAVESEAAAPLNQPGADESAVEFEPAYPADVSAEGLTEKDVAQQVTPHRHEGGEEHTHGDSTEHAAADEDHDDDQQDEN